MDWTTFWVCIASTGLFTYFLWTGFRTGVMPARYWLNAHRERNPATFWFMATIHSVFLLVSIACLVETIWASRA